MIDEFIEAINNGYVIDYSVINLDFLNKVREKINKNYLDKTI